jgi:hypothetical protein
MDDCSVNLVIIHADVADEISSHPSINRTTLNLNFTIPCPLFPLWDINSGLLESLRLKLGTCNHSPYKFASIWLSNGTHVWQSGEQDKCFKTPRTCIFSHSADRNEGTGGEQEQRPKHGIISHELAMLDAELPVLSYSCFRVFSSLPVRGNSQMYDEGESGRNKHSPRQPT